MIKNERRFIKKKMIEKKEKNENALSKKKGKAPSRYGDEIKKKAVQLYQGDGKGVKEIEAILKSAKSKEIKRWLRKAGIPNPANNR